MCSYEAAIVILGVAFGDLSIIWGGGGGGVKCSVMVKKFTDYPQMHRIFLLPTFKCVKHFGTPPLHCSHTVILSCMFEVE